MTEKECCCFCLEDIDDKNAVIKLQCNHIFHKICYQQDSGETCPLCRGSKIVTSVLTHQTSLSNYKDTDYVWMFGSFFPASQSQRDNHIICKMHNKKLSSGYFWRLYDDKLSAHLETTYKNFIANSADNKTLLCIGASEYKVHFDGFTLETDLNSIGTNVTFCTQTNISHKIRPILRISWKDAIEHLMIIGIHDNMFFDNIYGYEKNTKFYLFDMITQCKLNQIYSNTTNYIQQNDAIYDLANKEQVKLNVMGKKYKIKNDMIQHKETSYVITKFINQQIVNY